MSGRDYRSGRTGTTDPRYRLSEWAPPRTEAGRRLDRDWGDYDPIRREAWLKAVRAVEAWDNLDSSTTGVTWSEAVPYIAAEYERLASPPAATSTEAE